MPYLSVVVPMYDEEAVVDLFVERLRPVLDDLTLEGIPVSYEVVCVDDGSTDRTAAKVTEHRAGWPELRLVRLVRNSGHQAALSAGYERAEGEYVVTMDADLQDPPEVVAQMLTVAHAEKVDVVYGVRGDRSSDSWFKRTTAGLYYRLMRREAGPQVPSNAGDFRLVSRRVVTALTGLPEHGRVYRLVIPWFGFPSATVTHARAPRAAGRTKYPLGRMISLGLDSLTAFSALPLRLATWAGLFGVVVALGAMVYSVGGWLFGVTVPGWTSILATVGLIGAIQLICLGLMGEYVARLFVSAQARPTYLVGYDSSRDSSRDWDSNRLLPPAEPGPVAEAEREEQRMSGPGRPGT